MITGQWVIILYCKILDSFILQSLQHIQATKERNQHQAELVWQWGRTRKAPVRNRQAETVSGRNHLKAALTSDRGQVHPDKVQNRPYGGHFGSDQNFTWRASRSYHRSWLCPIWMKSVHSCLRTGRGQKKVNRRTTDGRRTDILSMTIAHRWAKKAKNVFTLTYEFVKKTWVLGQAALPWLLIMKLRFRKGLLNLNLSHANQGRICLEDQFQVYQSFLKSKSIDNVNLYM